MIGPFTSIEHGYTRAFQFKGRASRSEYWFFETYLLLVQAFLIYFDLMNAVRIIDLEPVMTVNDLSGMMTFWSFWFILIHMPARFAMHVRRLNDAGLSPRWAALTILPLFGRLMAPVMSKPSEGDISAYINSSMPVRHNPFLRMI